jgi:hypothetical protein
MQVGYTHLQTLELHSSGIARFFGAKRVIKMAALKRNNEL